MVRILVNCRMVREMTTECDGSGEAEIMEKAAAASGGRKRKFLLGGSEMSTNSVDQFKTRRLAVSTPDTPSSPQREDELSVEFFATTAGNSVDFSDGREKSSSSKAQVDSGELASTAGLYQFISNRYSPADKMPSHAEIEEFFAAAEKNLQKQFIDKYNYDIAKDEPTEGRYEWVRLNSTKAIMKKAENGHH